MEVKIKISPLFADKKIKELLEYYKVGKVKIKDLSFHLNNEEVNLNSTLNLTDNLPILVPVFTSVETNISSLNVKFIKPVPAIFTSLK